MEDQIYLLLGFSVVILAAGAFFGLPLTTLVIVSKLRRDYRRSASRQSRQFRKLDNALLRQRILMAQLQAEPLKRQEVQRAADTSAVSSVESARESAQPAVLVPETVPPRDNARGDDHES